MTDLVIFDCDGVLVDSEHLVVQIEAEMLGELGVAISTDEIVRRFVGLSDATMANEIHRDWGVVLPDTFDAERAIRVMDVFESQLVAVDGIRRVLGGLTVPCCVASSSALPRIRRSLELTALAVPFGDHVYSASMVSRGKPAPDLFLYAAAQFGVSTERCVVIEDSPHGVAAGVAAGMTTIGFTAGHHCGPDQADRLREAGATVVVATSNGLAEVLHRNGGAIAEPPDRGHR